MAVSYFGTLYAIRAVLPVMAESSACTRPRPPSGQCATSVKPLTFT